jgi:phosphate-selective porin OprO/OprP
MFFSDISPERDYPRFTGTYLSASWVITGESRPYIRSLGYTGGIVPKRRFGAAEIVGRFGYVNLTEELIEAGTMNHWYFGANWWASRQWKIGVSYGDCSLDRDALTGNTKMLQCRLLWMY